MTITTCADTGTEAVAATPQRALDIAGACKSYGSIPAVVDLTFTIRRGETVALLGPNGAGKTTTIGMILGLLDPDRGTVSVFGRRPAQAIAAGRVGAMLQDGGMMQGVSVSELLSMLRSLYPNQMDMRRAVQIAQLEGVEGRRVDRLSGGQTQRLRLAVALIANPDLLVLDEPTAAMDVEARRRFWREMRQLAGAGRTILYSTHYLDEADENCDRVVVLSKGRVVADGTPQSIKASVATRVLRFTSAFASAAALERVVGGDVLTVRGERVEIRAADSDSVLRAVLRMCPDAHDIEVTGVGLEDAFLALTVTGSNQVGVDR
ncbi:MAG: ABC transporter ATP-binding protein [Candidatus Dormibacteraeota bacterium]|nr:ABC transporter ATP-binding protein [Candidatus Dormibacteraeota bacterium]MBV9525911.1 ABC transporter ATP-binding protein [Candidatus Dormibacteraeota bacterium]